MGIKYLIITITFIIILSSAIIAKSKNNKVVQDPIESFYKINSSLINGEKVNMGSYKGKKILIVNVASECGLTPQYKELEALYQKHSDKLIVLGFPSNDFLSQEPGTNEEIRNFCESHYSISFPIFKKIKVKGQDKDIVYEWLTNPQKNGWNKKGPSWNFTKYLIDENGKLIHRFSPRISPLSEKITSKI